MRARISTRWRVVGLAVVALAPGCVTVTPAPTGPRGTNPDLEGGAIAQRSVMAAGSVETTFHRIRTVGFADTLRGPVEEVAEPTTERARLGAALRAQIKAHFVNAGYEWVDEGPAQRIVEYAWFLSESDGLGELDALTRIAPGIPDVGSLERGMIVLAFSWPGRAEPVCRVSIDGVGRLDWLENAKLDRIPDSLAMMLKDLPKGPVEPELEPTEDEGVGTEASPDPGTSSGPDASPVEEDSSVGGR